ncbi:MAG: ketoacyl-ACP synthase III [Actinomycetota bacterium]|nr:ketoacyl-ACP synthase III [Actinomycetota bacterium]
MKASVARYGTRVGITGVGVYVPERVLTNADLEQMVQTSDEWITERTGIKERRIAADGEAASDMALPAARQALERAGVEAEDVDVVLVATSTPDMLFPTTATLVARDLGSTRAAAYDILAACSGFIYGLAQAYSAVSSGVSKKVLVVGSEALSTIVDWDDRGTCILFGDGAGAAVVEEVAEGGFLGFELGADGSGGDDLYVAAGGSRNPASAETVANEMHLIRMKGQEVFRFATRVMVSSAANLLEECEATVDDVDLYVPHQANKRIIDHAAKNLGLPPEKVFVNIDRYGNTSAASIPIGLAEAIEQGSLAPGTNVLMSAVGGGFTWGSAFMTWSDGSR